MQVDAEVVTKLEGKRMLGKMKGEQVGKRGIRTGLRGLRELKRQKLQQLTSHGFFMSLGARLAFQSPHLRGGQKEGGMEGDKGTGG